jgi:hypothetical protein
LFVFLLKDEKFMFKITPKGSLECILGAPTNAEKDRWVSEIRKAVDMAGIPKAKRKEILQRSSSYALMRGMDPTKKVTSPILTRHH